MFSGSGTSNPQIQSCYVLNGMLCGTGTVRGEGTMKCSVNFVGDTRSERVLFFEDSIQSEATGIINGCAFGCYAGIRGALRQCKLDLNIANV